MRNPTASGARELGSGGDGVAPARQGHGSHVTEGWVAPEGHIELRGAHAALTCAVEDATSSAGLLLPVCLEWLTRLLDYGDRCARNHSSECLHWEGFPLILWEVLNAAGYA